MKASDGQLIEGTLSGSLEAFDRLMQRYQGQVYGVAFRVLGDSESAMDVTQETFVKAYRRLGQLRRASRFRWWLTRIAVNESRNWLRRYGGSFDYEELDPALRDPGERPEEATLRRDKRKTLLAGLDRLNPKQRNAVLLRYFQDLPLREIAAVMGCSEGVVKNILHRSLRKLRSELEMRWQQS